LSDTDWLRVADIDGIFSTFGPKRIVCDSHDVTPRDTSEVKACFHATVTVAVTVVVTIPQISRCTFLDIHDSGPTGDLEVLGLHVAMTFICGLDWTWRRQIHAVAGASGILYVFG